jgi:hypothetical protein
MKQLTPFLALSFVLTSCLEMNIEGGKPINDELSKMNSCSIEFNGAFAAGSESACPGNPAGLGDCPSSGDFRFAGQIWRSPSSIATYSSEGCTQEISMSPTPMEAKFLIAQAAPNFTSHAQQPLIVCPVGECHSCFFSQGVFWKASGNNSQFTKEICSYAY